MIFVGPEKFGEFISSYYYKILERSIDFIRLLHPHLKCVVCGKAFVYYIEPARVNLTGCCLSVCMSVGSSVCLASSSSAQVLPKVANDSVAFEGVPEAGRFLEVVSDRVSIKIVTRFSD